MSDSFKITKGDRVQRIAADYTNGRTGEVLEIAHFERSIPDRKGGGSQPYSRARVLWRSTDYNGNPNGKTISTWVEVSPKNLKLLPEVGV